MTVRPSRGQKILAFCANSQGPGPGGKRRREPVKERQSRLSSARYGYHSTLTSGPPFAKNIVILVVLFLDLLSLTGHFICIFLQLLVDGSLVRATSFGWRLRGT